MKHLSRHVNSQVLLANQRDNELTWMLKNSPYIAGSGEVDRSYFVNKVTNMGHNSHRQLAALKPNQGTSEYLQLSPPYSGVMERKGSNTPIHERAQ